MRKEQTLQDISLSDLRGYFGKGRFATVTFVKKEDNSVRVLNGKTKVERGLVGAGEAYDAEKHNQLRIFDVNIKDKKTGVRVGGYRTVTVDRVLQVASNHMIYKIAREIGESQSFVTDVYTVFGQLHVKLNGKHLYKYAGVPTSVIYEFMTASSKGQFFNDNIRNKYSYERLT